MSSSVLIGTASSVAALAGFYVANSVVLDLGPHPWFRDVQLAVDGGRRWFQLGLLSGPFMGAIGGLWRRSGSRALGVTVCALLIAEPFLEWAMVNRSMGFFAVTTDDPSVWVGETLIGVAACIAVVCFTQPSAEVGLIAGHEQPAE